MAAELSASIRVGRVEVTRLVDLTASFPAPVDQMFPSVAPGEWPGFQELYPQAFDGPQTWVASVTCHLIRTPDRTILVDTGVGSAETAFARFLGAGGALLDRLRDIQVDPGDVDVVLLTHLHADHVGWNVAAGDGSPLFPNARYVAHQADWAMSRERLAEGAPTAAYVRENVLPLHDAGRLDLVREPIALAEGVTTIHTPGHTPGHMSVRIEASDGQALWLLGDVMAHPLQVTQPEHHYAFDAEPRTAADTRSQVLDAIDREDAVAAACHFPDIGFGRIVRSDGRRLWEPIR